MSIIYPKSFQILDTWKVYLNGQGNITCNKSYFQVGRLNYTVNNSTTDGVYPVLRQGGSVSDINSGNIPVYT